MALLAVEAGCWLVGPSGAACGTRVGVEILVVEVGCGCGGVGAFGALVCFVTQLATCIAQGTGLVSEIGELAVGTDGPATVGVGLEEVASGTAVGGSAVVGESGAGLADGGALETLVGTLEGVVVLPFGTGGGAGVLADVLVVAGSAVAGLAVVGGVAGAGEAASGAGVAGARRGVAVVARQTDGDAGAAAGEEQVDAVDSAAGGAVA